MSQKSYIQEGHICVPHTQTHIHMYRSVHRHTHTNHNKFKKIKSSNMLFNIWKLLYNLKTNYYRKSQGDRVIINIEI